MTDNDPFTEVQPSFSWRIASTATIAIVGVLSKAFLNITNKTTVHGLDGFTKLLDDRKDPNNRERGLITISNHVSVVDDPTMWGVVPLRHMIYPPNVRWSLGSHDICFQNRIMSTLFTLGQTLPTHRHAYSPHGGLFQPTISQAIRLLSRGPFTTPTPPHPSWSKPSLPPPNSKPTQHDPLIPSPHSDPFTDPSTSAYSIAMTYTTNQSDSFPAPSVFHDNRLAWVHVFPEGQIRQTTAPDGSRTHEMRYWKWGVARMVLEAEPCPDVVPIYVAGFEDVMREERTFPRYLPRVGKSIHIRFGGKLERVELERYRERWKRLREKFGGKADETVVVETNEALMNGKEARQLRKELTRYLRAKVENLRVEAGETPEGDAKMATPEYWAQTTVTEKETWT